MVEHVATRQHRYHRWCFGLLCVAGVAVGGLLHGHGRSWCRPAAPCSYAGRDDQRRGGRGASRRGPATHSGRSDSTGTGLPSRPQTGPFGYGGKPKQLGGPEPLGTNYITADLYGKDGDYVNDTFEYHPRKENEIEPGCRSRRRLRVPSAARGQQSFFLREVRGEDGGPTCGLGGPDDRAAVGDPEEGQSAAPATLLRLCSLGPFRKKTPEGPEVPVLCTTRRRDLRIKDGAGTLVLQPLAGILQSVENGPGDDEHHKPLEPDGVGSAGGEASSTVSWVLGPGGSCRRSRARGVYGENPGQVAAGDGSRGPSTLGMAPRGTVEHCVGQGPTRQRLLGRAGAHTSNLVDGKGIKGKATDAYGGDGGSVDAWRPTSPTTRPRRDGHRGWQEEESNKERGSQEKTAGRKGRVAGLPERWQRWRNKGFWGPHRKRWSLRPGALRRTGTRGGLQSKGGAQTPVHHLPLLWTPFERMPFEEEVIYLLKYLLVICGGGEAEGEGAKEPKEEPERVAVPGTSVNKDVRKYTRRRELTGEDPEGEDEPPKDKIHVKGDYLTYEEFLKVRKFIFVHHFSGPVDKLSEAVRAEAERAGLMVETFSADLELGQNLMDDEPYKTHRLAASKGKIDGYHSGFPCTTFTKLRWRPCPGMPGPVRSKEHPYGFPDLNVREEEECRVGTVLMARTTVMVDAMYKADRFIKVPCFATVENPPPSEVESHISAWHMPEMVALVDKVPDWKCAHFNTCAYQSNLEPGTRHYKPQMIGRNLPGIEALNRSCQCGHRPHEPVVGKERSKKSAEYPDEFCAAYAVLAVRHFTKMAQAEFLEGRLVLLNNRINYLKGATADTVQEAEDIDESSNQIMESDDFQRGLTIKRLFVEVQDKERKKRRRVQKPEGEQQQEEAREEGEPGGEKNSPPAADVADLSKGSSASSSGQVTWSGGHGKHGMLKEPKGKNEVPRALVYIGGMRGNLWVPRCGRDGSPSSKSTRRHWTWQRPTARRTATTNRRSSRGGEVSSARCGALQSRAWC